MALRLVRAAARAPARVPCTRPVWRRWCSASAGPYKVGDFVEARDGSEKWRFGFVVAVDYTGEPKVLCDGWTDPAYFGQVRKIETAPAPEWAKPGMRMLMGEEKATIDRIHQGVVWATADGWGSKSRHVTQPMAPLEESLADELLFLVKYPSRIISVLKMEGPAVFGLYFLIRSPLFLLTIYTTAHAPGSQVAALGASLVLVGHISRPLCAYMALFIARKKRYWSERQAKVKASSA
eukprot:TRINITY_DN2370_c0_g1_i1.p1 TRINITY_DN2370_c0_g1~~TRINITY_DN2370_c0_g1_i1.p1  ORF type:complete len:236 (+),score=73.42 TRINITY_DN2370_c0_g1_i1:55-762(+)